MSVLPDRTSVILFGNCEKHLFPEIYYLYHLHEDFTILKKFLKANE